MGIVVMKGQVHGDMELLMKASGQMNTAKQSEELHLLSAIG
jgi:hypothetical protein